MTTITEGQRRSVVKIDYTNHRGERSWRNIIPKEMMFTSNDWYKEEQWLLAAFDLDKKLPRTFAMTNIHQWSVPE